MVTGLYSSYLYSSYIALIQLIQQKATSGKELQFINHANFNLNTYNYVTHVYMRPTRVGGSIRVGAVSTHEYRSLTYSMYRAFYY
jgi:hypothetical protein